MIEISTKKERLQVTIIHEFLTNSYWGKGRTIEEVQKSIDNCLCFGVYIQDKQIGFARVATDYTIFAYLMDVFILPEYRSKGYSKELMHVIHNYKALEGCSVWMLKTADAHGLYKQFGYTNLSNPEKVMERLLK